MNSTDAPIDTEELLEIMDDDDELLRECFDDFINDCPGMLAEIKAAIDGGDAEQLEKTAHTLKGSLRYLAAKAAADAAYKLENMGRSGEMDEAAGVFSSLELECERVKEFMTRY